MLPDFLEVGVKLHQHYDNLHCESHQQLPLHAKQERAWVDLLLLESGLDLWGIYWVRFVPSGARCLGIRCVSVKLSAELGRAVKINSTIMDTARSLWV